MRGFFSRRKADDAGVLTHAKEDNAAAREKDRKDKCISELINYNTSNEISTSAIESEVEIVSLFFIKARIVGVKVF